jgi:GGDEF domain-containing protein
VDTKTPQYLLTIIENINQALTDFNMNSGKPFALSCTFGYGIYNSDAQSFHSFLRDIDKKMYYNKAQKKGDSTPI